MNKPLVLSLILVGALGYFMGSYFGFSGSKSIADKKLLSNLEEIKKTFPQPADSNIISGQVEFVGDNFVRLSTPASNPFDEAPNLREVIVAKSTTIVRSESKPIEVIKKEQADYQKKILTWKPGSSTAEPVLPTNFIEKEISISDIKIGDRLVVEADSQIRMVKEFIALKITVQATVIPLN